MPDPRWIVRYAVTAVAVTIFWYVSWRSRLVPSFVVGVVVAIVIVDGYRIFKMIESRQSDG